MRPIVILRNRPRILQTGHGLSRVGADGKGNRGAPPPRPGTAADAASRSHRMVMANRFPRSAFALPLLAALTGNAAVAAGQGLDAGGAGAAGQVERFERTLTQIQRDTRLQVLQDVPVGSRALFDYGGYFTASYLSFDDPADTNRAFRGYDLVGYARADFDGAH